MYIKRSTALLGLLFLCISMAFSQDEMRWDFSLKDVGNGEIELVADVQIKQDGIFMIQRFPTADLLPHKSVLTGSSARNPSVNFTPTQKLR